MNFHEKLKTIIQDKGTNICLAADVCNVKELFNMIELLGDKICILKVHYDIIDGFFENFEETVTKLCVLKKKYNFFIWEDRKFADIGFIMERQINNHISRWADLVSIHPIAGEKSVLNIDKNISIGIILIGELSSESQLINKEYQSKVVEISKKLENLVGIVCQHKMTDTHMNIVPGIKLLENTTIQNNNDGKGQNYSLPEQRKFADILVVGRSIYKSDNPKSMIDKFLLN